MGEILIKGAKVHNLKNIDLELPRDKFIVVTGLSGSGKSSLAFDTLYAEGQRRYVESLSSYARQFLGRIDKPEVDYIKGIPPAIAIEQKVNTQNPRSTVGTSTEIYDYLKLLFARVGRTYSPVSGSLVKKHSVTDVVDFISSLGNDLNIMVLSPFSGMNGRNCKKNLEVLLQQGFTRIEINNEVVKISDILAKIENIKESVDDLISQFEHQNIHIVIDRFKHTEDEDFMSRVADSVQTAFFEGGGECIVRSYSSDYKTDTIFNNRFEADGLSFDEPDVHMFSFNNPVGACPTCEGFGKIIGIDEDLVIPDKNLSVYDDGIACWKGEKMSEYKQVLVKNAHKFDFPIHRSICELTDAERKLLWTGNQHFSGLNDFFAMLERDTYKIQYRVMLSRYRGRTVCPECKGTRLKKEASYVKVMGKSIHDLVLLPIDNLQNFFKTIELNDHDSKVAKRILIEIRSRLEFLCNVGLGYLTLNRLSSTLSGGESQRINLATSLGSSLVGSLYILDEPSIGLHPKDNHLLIKVLKQLQKIGNTVLVVEHDEEIIKSADHIVDIGPLAGRLGGEVIYNGNFKGLYECGKSLTSKYLRGELSIQIPPSVRKSKHNLIIKGAYEHNLKNITAKFPLDILTVVTGVSGSGKSTLVRDLLFGAITRHINGYGESPGKFSNLEGDIEHIEFVEFVDQNPIGKSSRSNPVTYIKAYDEIRKLFGQQQASIINGYTASHFSFNVDGGRCEECQGEGIIKVEMQFMADVHLVCESCKGHKFKDDILAVKYNDVNIYDVLEMTVDEAIDFFSKDKSTLTKKIVSKIKPLADVGLGYVKLGQSSSTLSGGESQRIKLASFLTKEKVDKKGLFIFDEPTTGLHFHDVSKLLDAFNALIDRGNSIVVIEHNLDIIKCADWIIDLGPEGGENGGNIVFEGTPSDIINCEKSYTGKFLKQKFNL